MERDTDRKDHKKRLRQSQKLRKEARTQEIFSVIANNASELSAGLADTEDNPDKLIAALFKPIQNREEDAGLLWERVPPVCSPHLSRLGPSLVSPHMMAVEEARQRKLRKKLDRQVESGAITEEERQVQLEKVDRESASDSYQLLGADRGTRKRQQVENIASLLKQQNMESLKVVVDFGSGSGNLCLVLASFYPDTTFVFVDQNTKSLDILKRRAAEAELSNIVVRHFTFTRNNLELFIQEISTEVGQIDLGIGLHSCGTFTDLVMEVCRLARSDCLVVPCCNGKVLSSQENYPRSNLMASLITKEDYTILSSAADDLSQYSAKCLVEYDRGKWAEESGAAVEYLKMDPVTASPKHLVLYCSF